MPNVHSHAFQRALRGVGERPPRDAADDFWSWREAMYALAAALDPDSMYAAGLRVYREMAAAGYGVVGEFHYVHHQPDGTPYEDPNALAVALAEAAREAGLRIVLLPAAYHRAGWDGRDLPPTPGQRRFCDADVETFLSRVDALRAWAAGRDGVDVGVAAHSVRAVPSAWLSAIARYADDHDLVRHVHAHEQRREIDECVAEHGCTPIELLDRTGFLSARTTLVHGVHVTPRDVSLLAASETIVATCPTTEGNLGDGHLPALAYRDAGRPARRRQRPEHDRRSLRGGPRARDAGPARAPDAPRAAQRHRRPLGRGRRRRAPEPRRRRGRRGPDHGGPRPSAPGGRPGGGRAPRDRDLRRRRRGGPVPEAASRPTRPVR